MATVYLASPYGFARSSELFLPLLREALRASHTVFDPWEMSKPLVDEYFPRGMATDSLAKKTEIFHEMNYKLSKQNEKAIEKADIVVAGLDGVDVDSGTASEIGFAYARGKKIFGYRNDYRRSGENEGMVVNPQVQYWIEASGGRICDSIPTLLAAVRPKAKMRKQ